MPAEAVSVRIPEPVAGAPAISPAVRLEALAHDYGSRRALAGITLDLAAGSLCGILGPNGGGKTTLFRILATLVRPTSGRALIFGHDTARAAPEVRRALGVVFQAPAIDRRLTVRENLVVHAALYGLRGRSLARSIDARLERFGLADRAGDLAGRLSGGLLRRVEIAKALLPRPRLLLLDEPSTGLDPAARAELWDQIAALRDRDGVTVLFTTHLLEEAERADRVAILSEGRVVADGAPGDLTAAIGGEVLVIRPHDGDAAALIAPIEAATGVTARALDGTLRLEAPDLHRLVPRVIEAAPGRIASITLGRPTLLDVFTQATGRRFDRDEVRS
ncbi:MAG TPA: ATP-binding cassette domain-containing protein [Dongiaceae bacterium]|nr:ATP-binding cassette domain-containing protein [Dongiaceae bacterium]